MNSRRTVILIVALVMSAVSAFGILNYVRGVEDSANAEEVLGTYWVVNQEIPKGTPIDDALDQKLLAEVSVSQELVPLNAVADPAGELKGQVAVINLGVNFPVIEGTFVSPDVVATGITERLAADGLVTVTLGLDQTKTVAYHIEPGDFVNVLSVTPVEYPEDKTQEGLPLEERTDLAYEHNRDAVGPFAYDPRYLYQGAEVLSVAKALTPQLGDSAVSSEEGVDEAPLGNQGLITLAVPPEAVQTILAVGEANIYLSLLPHDYEPHAIEPIDIGLDQFPGELIEQLTPYGPEGKAEDEAIDPTKRP